MNIDNQWSKQEACFARATREWLAVSPKTSDFFANEFDVLSVLQRMGISGTTAKSR